MGLMPESTTTGLAGVFFLIRAPFLMLTLPTFSLPCALSGDGTPTENAGAGCVCGPSPKTKADGEGVEATDVSDGGLGSAGVWAAIAAGMLAPIIPPNMSLDGVLYSGADAAAGAAAAVFCSCTACSRETRSPMVMPLSDWLRSKPMMSSRAAGSTCALGSSPSPSAMPPSCGRLLTRSAWPKTAHKQRLAQDCSQAAPGPSSAGRCAC